MDPNVLEIAPGISIDEREIEEKFVRSSGPGGQNVNKVATAVELRFDASQSSSFPPDSLARLRALAGTRMTADGVLVIQARRFRTQAQNREDARTRLQELLRQALVVPRRRKKTRPSAQARQRRVETKRRRSVTKQGRAKPSGDE
jgi:ribosome-associated protein